MCRVKKSQFGKYVYTYVVFLIIIFMSFSESIKYHINSICSMLMIEMFVHYLKSVLLWTKTYQNIKLVLLIVLLVDQVPESDLWPLIILVIH